MLKQYNSNNTSRNQTKSVAVGQISLERLTFSSVFAMIQDARSRGILLPIGFCNAHTALLAFSDPDYRNYLSQMLMLNDGVGIDIAAKFLAGVRFPENLNGTDFVPEYLSSESKPLRIFLLGARPEVTAKAAQRFSTQFPRHTVVGYQHGYFSQKEIPNIIEKINQLETDLLLVAMGNPRQEQFIVANAHSLNCSLAMGVGALFDFMAQRVPRAPFLVRKMKLEWLFRLACEPRRLVGRYFLGIPLFLFAVSRYRLRPQ